MYRTRTSNRLTSIQPEDPVAIRQQINIEEARPTDEPLPDVWHKGMTNVPPYVAEFEGNSQKQPGAITKEGSRIAFLAQLLQEKIVKNNAKLKKAGPVISLARAKDLVYNQMIEKRTKPKKVYKVEEMFDANFLETKPHGVRHGAINAEESTWEGMPEHEILEGSMPNSSDLLIDSGHRL